MRRSNEAIDKAIAPLQGSIARFGPSEAWESLLAALAGHGWDDQELDFEEKTAHSEFCGCCEYAGPLEATGLCGTCSDIYKARPASLDEGSCSCGHAPSSHRKYVRQHRGLDVTFCSIACCSLDYKDLFGGLLALERMARS